MRYGRGRCRLVRKHADALTFGQIVPAALLAWVVLGAVLATFSRLFLLLYAISLAPWLLAILFFSARLAWRHGWRHFFLAPPIYATIHFSLGAGFLSELVRGTRRNLSPHSQQSPKTAKVDPGSVLPGERPRARPEI
jgi:succinoglycan biosynthesis protein ExoA